MSSSLSFAVTPSSHPRSAEERAKILEKPGFGLHFTDHMVAVKWDKETGWHDAAVHAYGPISLDPAAAVLHYGQEIFEGLKAYRQPDGSIAAFRPEANALRLQRSAERLAMPPLPVDDFIESLRALLAADNAWVPPAGGEESLYLRPFMFASQAGLAILREGGNDAADHEQHQPEHDHRLAPEAVGGRAEGDLQEGLGQAVGTDRHAHQGHVVAAGHAVGVHREDGQDEEEPQHAQGKDRRQRGTGAALGRAHLVDVGRSH